MPSRKPRLVLDTDMASKLWRSKLDQSSQQKLVGVTPVLTYITLAEWWQWAHHRGWGPAKISEMRTYAPLLTHDQDFKPLAAQGLTPR